MTPVTELGELDSTFRKSDTGALKAFLTAEVDTYRPPYGAITLQLPRATIFCATVNRIDFLMDETGNRRFWPIEVLDVDADHDVDMQQVWAEAHVMWEAGEQWWLSPSEHENQSKHSSYYRVTNSVEEKFNQYVIDTEHQKPEQYAPMNVTMLRESLGIENREQHVSTLRRLIGTRFGQKYNRVKGVQNAWMVPDPTCMSVLGLPNQEDD